MFKMKLVCTTHAEAPVISAEATREALIAPFVFVKDKNENWVLDESNLYCTATEGWYDHKFTFVLYDEDGNYLAGETDLNKRG